VPGWKWCKLAALGPARDAFRESRRLSSALKADERLDLRGMPNEGGMYRGRDVRYEFHLGTWARDFSLSLLPPLCNDLS